MCSKQTIYVGPYEEISQQYSKEYVRHMLGHNARYIIKYHAELYWPFKYSVDKFEECDSAGAPIKFEECDSVGAPIIFGGYYGKICFFTLWGAKRYLDKKLREHGVKFLTQEQFDKLQILL